MPIKVTQENFAQEVEQSNLPVVVDVFAPWCGPCRQMEPIFEQLEKEIGHAYKFVKLNVDEARDLAIKYGITSIPTFLFIKNNTVLAKETGSKSKEELKKIIQEVLK